MKYKRKNAKTKDRRIKQNLDSTDIYSHFRRKETDNTIKTRRKFVVPKQTKPKALDELAQSMNNLKST